VNQDQRGGKMEYLIDRFEPDYQTGLIDRLNELGQENWNVFQIDTQAGNSNRMLYIIYCSRRLE
jgi:hypothetical protein